MIEFIGKNEFYVPESIVDYVRATPSLKQPILDGLHEKLNRTQRLINEGLDLTTPDALLTIKITRQKIRAIKAAIQQLEGV